MELDQQLRDRRALHQELSTAIRNGELSLHYQPQATTAARIGDAEVTGFEALARWIHPTRGFVPPGEFIPLAEESGLIVEMGEWILRQACREAAAWPIPLQIGINLSPAQFMHGDLVGLVHSILLETGLKPGTSLYRVALDGGALLRVARANAARHNDDWQPGARVSAFVSPDDCVVLTS